MSSIRVLRLYDALVVVMAGSWLVNLYLGLAHAPIDWRGSIGIPLLVLLAASVLLRHALGVQIGRGETEISHVGVWRLIAAAGMLIIAAAALLLGMWVQR